MDRSTRGAVRTDERFAVIERVRRAAWWTGAGSVAAVAVIVGAVSNQIPGRTTTTGAATPAPATSGAAGTGTTGNTGTTSGTGSAPAPSSTQQAPVTVSGGSGW